MTHASPRGDWSNGQIRLEPGSRIGRFVVVRDVDGRAHAIAVGSIAEICDADDGALLMLTGGRMVRVPEDLATVVGWLDAR